MAQDRKQRKAVYLEFVRRVQRGMWEIPLGRWMLHEFEDVFVYSVFVFSTTPHPASTMHKR